MGLRLVGSKFGFHGAVLLRTSRFVYRVEFLAFDASCSLHVHRLTVKSSFQAPQQDANQWNGNYYGYQQGYDSSYYGAPNAQDPSAQNYYGYSGYGNSEQQQEPPQQQQQPPQQPPQQV